MNPETLRALEQMNSTLTQQNVADRERSEQLSGAIVSVSAARASALSPKIRRQITPQPSPAPASYPPSSTALSSADCRRWHPV